MERKFKSLTEDAVKQIVSEYFVNNKYELNVEMRGERAVIQLSYIDFKPTRVVRTELENLIGNIELEILKRDYSFEAIHDACDEIVTSDQKFYVVIPGSNDMKQVSLYSIIDNMLYYRTI